MLVKIARLSVAVSVQWRKTTTATTLIYTISQHALSIAVWDRVVQS